MKPTALFSAHGTTNDDTRELRTASYTDIDLLYQWEAYGGFPWSSLATSYARTPAKPCFLFEGQYEGSADTAQIRRQAYQSVLAGGCGHTYGHSGLWAFSSPVVDSTDWTTTSLVTSSLGDTTARICPALASNGSFAMIWTPSSTSLTVNLNALTGIAGTVRARRYNPTNGTFSAIGTYTKSSSQSISSGGEGVVVLDAA